MTDVRALLHDLAADAPRAHGEDTADRVVELHRAQDRRRLRWAGVAAAVAVVVAVVPALVTRSSPADTTAVAAGGEVASLFDAPTRGSLAGDGEAVAAALSASWEDGIPYNDEGRILDPASQDRHVAFIGEVPDGQIWALVIGRTGGQLAYAWFVDVDPGADLELRLAVPPERTTAGLPIALVDGGGERGVMVVVALPGQGVVLDGSTVGRVEVEDGIALVDGATPGGGLDLPVYRLTGPGSDVAGLSVRVFDSTRPLGQFAAVPTVPPVDPADASVFIDCMSSGGWAISTLPDGRLTYAEPLSVPELTEFSSTAQVCLQTIAAQAAAGD